MFIFGGLKAAVSISGTVSTGLNEPSSNQSIRTYSGSPALNTAYQTLLTPTGGKVYYLTTIIWSDVNGGDVYFADNGTELLKFTVQAGGQSPKVINLTTPIRIATTVQVKTQFSATQPVCFVGFEV